MTVMLPFKYCPRRLLSGLLLALVLTQTSAPRSCAQTAGKVDPTFGASLGLAGATQVIGQKSGGQLIVGGEFPKGIAQLNADGSRDLTFDPGTGANGPVTVLLVQSDGKTLVGGAFTSVNGTSCGGLARFNANGSLDTGFTASVVGTPQVLVQQSDGKILLGGNFSSVNGSSRTNVARLLTSGALDPAFDPTTTADGEVDAFAVQTNGDIVLAGQFSNVNGVAHARVARLDGSGNLDATFSPSADAAVYALALQSNGSILVAGNFANVNGTARTDVARLLASGALDTGFKPVLDGLVGSMVLEPSGEILLDGQFTTVNGTLRSNFALLSTGGTLDQNFDSGIDGLPIPSINAHSSDPLLYDSATGFVYVAPDGYLDRLTSAGIVDTTYKPDEAPGPNATVGSVNIEPDGKLLIDGNFTMISGNVRLGVGRLNADGSFDPTFDPGYDGINFVAQSQPDGETLVGRAPTLIDGVTRNGLVRLDTTGAEDPSFTSSVSGSYTGLQLQPDGKVLACVDLTTDDVANLDPNTLVRLGSNGVEDPNFARATVDGALASEIPATGTEYVLELNSPVLQSNGSAIIYGLFDQVNSTTVYGIARVSSAGAVDASFHPFLQGGPAAVADGTGLVYSAAVQPTDQKIVIGGAFTSVSASLFGSSTARNNIARLNTNGSPDATFNPGTGANGYVIAVAVDSDGKILIGGTFTQVNGVARNGVARLLPTGVLDMTFNPGSGIAGGGSMQGVYSLTVQSDKKIIASGDFTSVNGVVRNYVARFNPDGSVDPGFNPGLGNPSVAALAYRPDDSKIIVGGNFVSAGGQPVNALSRLNPDGSVDAGFNAGFNAGDNVPALVRQPADGNIVVSRVVAAASTNGGLSLLPHASTQVKNPIMRCNNADGSTDSTFDGNAGTDGTAFSLSLQAADGKIVVGGLFTQLNPTTDGATASHPNLGRLNADGTLDTSFNPTVNATVQVVLAQSDGHIVVGGLFTQVNNTPRTRLARLDVDGTLDASFSATAGTDGPVAALKLQSDGQLLVGGSFATAGGTAHPCLARFKTDGTLDPGFNAGTISLAGGTALVSSIDEQVDGKVIIAGLFDHVAGTALNNVARLKTDGAVDNTFNPGAGPNAIVNAIALQPDGKTLLGGNFTAVDNLERDAAARLLGDYDLDDYPALGQWRIINFGQPDATGNAADTAAPFGDGVPNLVKYALNLNAQAPDATPMTATGSKGLPLLGKDASGHHLTLTFVRRQAATAPGISYVVEFANGLNDPAGFAVNPAATSTVTTIDAIWERVTVTDSVLISARPPTRFVHLRLTDP